MVVGRVIAYALAAATATSKTRHVRFCRGFINEYEPLCIPAHRASHPLLPVKANVRPVLFVGRQRFF